MRKWWPNADSEPSQREPSRVGLCPQAVMNWVQGRLKGFSFEIGDQPPGFRLRNDPERRHLRLTARSFGIIFGYNANCGLPFPR